MADAAFQVFFSEIRLFHQGITHRDGLREISPGFGYVPPPIMAMPKQNDADFDMEAWFQRGNSFHLIDVKLITSSWASFVNGGKMDGKLSASILFPQPGGPVIKT